MRVINVAGFDVEFEKNEKKYKVPADNQLHFIPDVCFFEDNFQGLLRVVVPPTSVKKAVNEIPNADLNDPKVKEDVIEKSKPKPLSGKKLKPKIRAKLRKTKPTGKKKVTTEG